MTPALSVIIPVLNDAVPLARLLAELADWRAAGDEVIVVDGGSADRSAEVAANGSDRVIVAPRGRASQMNAGAAVARSGRLWFVHADSGLGAVSREALLTFQAWGFFDVRMDDAHPVLKLVAAAMNLRSRLSRIATGDQALFVTRTLFQQVGGFPLLPLMEDIELSSRLRSCARPERPCGQVRIASRRWRQNGVIRTIGLMWTLRLAWFLGVPAERLARIYGYR